MNGIVAREVKGNFDHALELGIGDNHQQVITQGKIIMSLRQVHSSLFYQALGLVAIFLGLSFGTVFGSTDHVHSADHCFFTPWLELEANRHELKTLLFWPKFYLRTLSPQYYAENVYALADKAQAHLLNMDLDDVFDLLPEKIPSNRAHLCLKGDGQGTQNFQVHFSSYQRQSELPEQQGDFTFNFALQKERNAGKQYFPELHTEAHLGPHSVASINRAFQSQFKILAAMDGATVLRTLREDFPTTMQMFERYILIKIEVVSQAKERKILSLELKSKENAWSGTFPKIAKYLWRLSDVIWGKVVIIDHAGLPWAETEFDTESLTFKTKLAYTAEGTVPLTGEDSHAWKVGQDTFNGSLLCDFAFKVQGVRPVIQGYKVPFTFTPGQEHEQFFFFAGDKPKVKIESNIFTFLPVAFSKVFLGLEGDIYRFFRELGESRGGGKGELSVSVNSASKRALLTIDGHSKISNNLFIKLGFQMLAYRMIPDNETKNEWRSWWSELLHFVINDIETFSNRGKNEKN